MRRRLLVFLKKIGGLIFIANWLRIQTEPLDSFPLKLSDKIRGWKKSSQQEKGVVKGIISFAALINRVGPSSETHSVVQSSWPNSKLVLLRVPRIQHSIASSDVLLLKNHSRVRVSFFCT